MLSDITADTIFLLGFELQKQFLLFKNIPLSQFSHLRVANITIGKAGQSQAV
jgi:hypothetical protein